MIELNKEEKRLLLKLLLKVDDMDSDVIDLLELFTRREFQVAGAIIEKLKQDGVK